MSTDELLQEETDINNQVTITRNLVQAILILVGENLELKVLKKFSEGKASVVYGIVQAIGENFEQVSVRTTYSGIVTFIQDSSACKPPKDSISILNLENMPSEVPVNNLNTSDERKKLIRDAFNSEQTLALFIDFEAKSILYTKILLNPGLHPYDNLASNKRALQAVKKCAWWDLPCQQSQ